MHERYLNKLYHGGKEAKPHNKSDLETLARNPDFRRRVAQALLLTSNLSAPGCDLLPNGVREYGFVVYAYKSQYRNTLGKAIYATTIFQGESNEIALHAMYRESTAKLHDLIQPVVDFHTHPGLYADRTLKFSKGDLKNFYAIAKYDNPNLIRSIGGNTTDEGKTAKLLMVSFNNRRGLDTFDPVKVYQKSDQYDLLGRDPYEAYREAGLNVFYTSLDIQESLKSNQQIPFLSPDITHEYISYIYPNINNNKKEELSRIQYTIPQINKKFL